MNLNIYASSSTDTLTIQTSPSETLLIADTAIASTNPSAAYGVGGTSSAIVAYGTDFNAGYNACYGGVCNTTAIQARHGGQVANTGWCDGHAKSHKLSYYEPPASDDANQDMLKLHTQFNVGVVSKNPPQIQDAYAATPAQTLNDFYYYLPVKD